MLISSPGLASHRKLEQIPFFSSSSSFFSESQKVALRTHSEVVLPSNVSPYREAAMEYSRVPWGIFLPLEFVFSPCGAGCYNVCTRWAAWEQEVNRGSLYTYWWNDSIRLALPERDVAVGVYDNMAGFSSSLGTCDLLNRPDFSNKWLFRAEGVQGKLALFKLCWDLGFLFRSCSLCNNARLHTAASGLTASVSDRASKN